MVQTLIRNDLSETELTLKPGESTATFAVDVVNDSDRLASFQVEVLSAVSEMEDHSRKWYQLSPEVCSKKPPGDSTHFQVEILDTPIPGFSGLMNLTVRVFSLELPAVEDRQVLRLMIEQGRGAIPLEVRLADPKIQVYPGDDIDITAQVRHRGQEPSYGQVQLLGIEDWLVDRTPHFIHFPPGQWQTVVFPCRIPEAAKAISQIYPIHVEALHAHNVVTHQSGELQVLPTGYSQLTCDPRTQQLPLKRPWLITWKCWQPYPITYAITLENHSNLAETIQLETQKLRSDRLHRNTEMNLALDTVALPPGDTVETALSADVKRPWLGWVRRLLLQVNALSTDQRLDLRHDQQTLELRIFPIIPRWLQGVLLLLVLSLLTGLWQLFNFSFHHRDAVNSVAFNGIANQIISGSNDQTIRRWVVNRNRPRPTRPIIHANKAIRITRYQPVNNDVFAAGLENGEIQFWDLLSPRLEPFKTLVYNLDDRVLALTFTDDSRTFFSGHGSGNILQWRVPSRVGTGIDITSPEQVQTVDFAIADIELLGQDQEILAIAGRYNQLFLWPWHHSSLDSESIHSAELQAKPTPSQERNRTFHTPNSKFQSALIPITYPPGGQDDYITSLATARTHPHRLATADNQGMITLWNISQCTATNLAVRPGCEILDQWSDGHGISAVRAIALSANGCYLTSVGDDGKVMLWPLDPQGYRLANTRNGKQIKHLRSPLNSVDIQQVRATLRITSGGDDHKVRVYEHQLPNPSCE